MESLASWKGRRYVEDQIAERGFRIHAAVQKELINYCHASNLGDKADLELYWDEVAKECILSGGQADSFLRRVPNGGNYRSAYLDELAAKFDYAGSPFKNSFLHPCLHHRLVEDRRSGLLWQTLIKEMQAHKVSESERLKIAAHGWSGLKKDIMPILQKYAGSCGFREQRVPHPRGLGIPSKAFCKMNNVGLVLGCRVDAGGLPEATQLHLDFFVIHPDDPELSLWMGDFRNIVPGFELYDYFMRDPPENYVLGIRAFAELFDVFADSFA